MSTGRTDEFRKEAVRIALTSGLSRRQVADDLGVGFSTLNKWVSAHRDTGVVSAEDRELARVYSDNQDAMSATIRMRLRGWILG
jgi:transposase